jgi:hypothetical protein
MSNSGSNPLQKYYRQPKLYMKLPSGGRWYPPGSLEMTPTEELPVYAMTGKDELLLKTPDGLLSGQSTVDVVQSCVPNIKNAWVMPSVDLDAVLIAIRQATYGNKLEFTTACVHCQNKNELLLDLPMLADRIKCPDYTTPINVMNLSILLKPQDYQSMNTQGMETFEQQRILAMVADTAIAQDEKNARFQLMFNKLLDITVNQVGNCILGIKMPTGELVQDPAHIHEFIKNCEKPVWDAVKERLTLLADSMATKHIDLTCQNPECQKEYQAPLIFEQTNFFA